MEDCKIDLTKYFLCHSDDKSVILKIITNGDLIALGAHFYLLCLAKLYKKAKHMKKDI